MIKVGKDRPFCSLEHLRKVRKEITDFSKPSDPKSLKLAEAALKRMESRKHEDPKTRELLIEQLAEDLARFRD